MNKLFSVLIFCISFLNINFAQTATTYRDKESEVMCDCASKIDSTKGPIRAQFMKCIRAGMAPYYLESKKNEEEYKAANSTRRDEIASERMKNTMNSIPKLMQDCPKIRELSLAMAKEGGYDTVLTNLSATFDTHISTGKFMRLDTKSDFAKIIIKDNTGNESSFVWYTKFRNDAQFMGDGISLKDKVIKVRWREVQVYNPKTLSYSTIKQLMSVE